MSEKENIIVKIDIAKTYITYYENEILTHTVARTGNNLRMTDSKLAAILKEQYPNAEIKIIKEEETPKEKYSTPKIKIKKGEKENK